MKKRVVYTDPFEGCDSQQEWDNIEMGDTFEEISNNFTKTQKVCNNSHKLNFNHVSFGT